MKTVNTINLKGNGYAKVSDRLKIFREENPNSKILTELRLADNKATFKAYIWKNKADLVDLVRSGIDRELIMMTADANGTSQKEVNSKEKDFEKLETVAVGRALALLGYLASGEIASSEEMEEFEKFKADKLEESVNEAIALLENSKTLPALRKNFVGLDPKIRNHKLVIAKKDELKDKLSLKEVKNESN